MKSFYCLARVFPGVQTLSRGFKKILLFLLFVFFSHILTAQTWIEKIAEGNTNFYEIQKAFYEQYKHEQEKVDSVGEKDEQDGEYVKFKRWEWFMEPRVYPSGDITLPSRNWEYFQTYLQANPQVNQRSIQMTDSTSRSLSGNWTPLGPFTPASHPNFGFGGIGRIDFVRFDPTNPNIVWVGSPTGGLWKSINGGATWTTNTDLLTIIGCSDIAFDQTNTNIMYLATGDKDYGATNSIGVLKSTDGGITWNSTGLIWPVEFYYHISKLLIHPANSNILFAATSNGIYKTTDAGVTWSLIQSGNFGDIKFKPGAPATVYAVTKSGGLFYKSTNTGTSFVNITSGLPNTTEVNKFGIGVTQANPNYVYLLAINSTNNHFYGMYRSTNSGNGFTTQSTTPDIIGSQGWYTLSLTVNPSNSNEVFAGGLQNWRSIDGGVNWTQLCCTHVDIHELDFLPGSSTTLFSCNDGGIYKSYDNGITWNDMSNGLAISQMYRLATSVTNPTLNLTGLQDNGTFRQTNNQWDWIWLGDGMEGIIDYSNSNIMYAGGQNGQIDKSVDGGVNFSLIAGFGGTGINEYGFWVTPYIMNSKNHNTLLVAKTQVYRTTNGGDDWSQVGAISLNPNEKLRTIAYAPSDSNYIYTASTAKFYASTDGSSFSFRAINLIVNAGSITSIAVSNINPRKVWVTCSGYSEGGKIFMSEDAGVTWVNYSNGLPNLPANCIVYENGSNDRVYLGMDVGVYYRDNSMSSWQSFFDGLPNVIVNEMEIQYSTRKIRAATYGRGLWESDLIANCTASLNTWIGFVDSAWENPGNWSCGVIPGPNTDVEINSGNVVLSSNVIIRSLKINPTVNFTVSLGYNFTINH